LVRRLAAPGRQAPRFRRGGRIFGFVDVPVVYFSVTWWRTVHPGPVISTDALPRRCFSHSCHMFCTLVLAAVMIAIR